MTVTLSKTDFLAWVADTRNGDPGCIPAQNHIRAHKRDSAEDIYNDCRDGRWIRWVIRRTPGLERMRTDNAMDRALDAAWKAAKKVWNRKDYFETYQKLYAQELRKRFPWARIMRALTK